MKNYKTSEAGLFFFFFDFPWVKPIKFCATLRDEYIPA